MCFCQSSDSSKKVLLNVAAVCNQGLSCALGHYAYIQGQRQDGQGLLCCRVGELGGSSTNVGYSMLGLTIRVLGANQKKAYLYTIIIVTSGWYVACARASSIGEGTFFQMTQIFSKSLAASRSWKHKKVVRMRGPSWSFASWGSNSWDSIFVSCAWYYPILFPG